MHLCTVKTVIWKICSNRPRKKVPQSARLSAGGVESLFGQCPNRGAANRNEASLQCVKTNGVLYQCIHIDTTPLTSNGIMTLYKQRLTVATTFRVCISVKWSNLDNKFLNVGCVKEKHPSE